MNNISANTPSFGGSYVINYNIVSKKLRPNLEEIFPKGRMIFDNYMGKENQVLYILHDKHDYPVAQYIEKNKMRFAYMPEVNTKLGFETRTQFEDYIEQNSPKIIRNRKTLLEYTKEQFLSHTLNRKIFVRAEILKNFGFKPQDLRMVQDSQGSRIYRDLDGNPRIKLSPRSEQGHYYVLQKEGVYPYELNRFEFNEKGVRIRKYSTPDDLMEFKNKYKQAISYFCRSKCQKVD